MKRTTKKLSGVGLELFLRQFYAGYSAIDDALARRLSKDGAKTFTSVRVRRVAWRSWRPTPASPHDQGPAPDSGTAPPAIASPDAPVAPGTSVDAEAEAKPFDAYAIGLIPTFQREGGDGLLAKLSDISSIDNLRKMARAQQVALPAELRGPDTTIEDIRAAIVAAVAKRIADRRAAAG
jgi:hypothetical protein